MARTTSKRVARDASKILTNNKSSRKGKEIAASALSQRSKK